MRSRAAGCTVTSAIRSRAGDAPLAALFEAEVLHGIREVDVPAGDARGCERAVQGRAGGSDERLPGEVLSVTRLLPDEHDAGR